MRSFEEDDHSAYDITPVLRRTANDSMKSPRFEEDDHNACEITPVLKRTIREPMKSHPF